ncbi:MAG: hypothetical protein ACR2P1_08065 [Pseudomonadales bacterium]
MLFFLKMGKKPQNDPPHKVEHLNTTVREDEKMFKRIRRLQIISPTLVFVTTIAHSTPLEESLFLAVHSGHSGAAEIVDANYSAGERITRTAIEFATSARYWPSGRLELRNNLCVVQIMRGDKENAGKTCNRAVTQAKSLQPKYRQTRYKLRSVRAIAFSNRGVLRVLNSDTKGAKADFNAALRLRPALEHATRNLNAMRGENRHRSVAQINVMTAKSS